MKACPGSGLEAARHNDESELVCSPHLWNGWITMALSIELQDFDAVLFDLDGVLTTTRAVHAAAWRWSSSPFVPLSESSHERPKRVISPFIFGSPATTYGQLPESANTREGSGGWHFEGN